MKQETCHEPGCCDLQLIANYNYKKQGLAYYRKWCKTHYQIKRAANKGITPKEYLKQVQLNTAKNAGFETLTEYLNSTHPSRKYRKDYCENIDGRLGYKCNYPKKPFKEVSALLQVDHIDGNPFNNSKENFQTFCPNCHTYKSYVCGDLQTPGRKSLKTS